MAGMSASRTGRQQRPTPRASRARPHAAPRGKARVSGFSPSQTPAPSQPRRQSATIGGLFRRSTGGMGRLIGDPLKLFRITHIGSRIRGDNRRPRHADGPLPSYIYKHPPRLRLFLKRTPLDICPKQTTATNPYTGTGNGWPKKNSPAARSRRPPKTTETYVPPSGMPCRMNFSAGMS